MKWAVVTGVPLWRLVAFAVYCVLCVLVLLAVVRLVIAHPGPALAVFFAGQVALLAWHHRLPLRALAHR